MSTKSIRKSNNYLTIDTLLKIGMVGVCVIAASTSPFFLRNIVKAYFKEKSRRRANARARKLRELQQRNLISFRELADGSVKIELTHLGKKLVRQYNLDKMQIKKPKIWDGKWYVIIYDIPHSRKQARDAFRQKLKQLNLYPLQKSVWVTPFNCLPEIEFLCSIFNLTLDQHIYYFTTNEIPQEKKLKRFFALS